MAARMSACALMRFLDFILIDNKVLKRDSHSYVVANGISTTRQFHKSWKHNHSWAPTLFQRFTLKLHLKRTIWTQFYEIFFQLSIIWHLIRI